MDKQHAHDLLDQLDPGQLDAVGHLLEVMLEPAERAALEGPTDGEPLSEGRENRRREFFQKLKANLGNENPQQRDQMVDEFQKLIRGG